MRYSSTIYQCYIKRFTKEKAPNLCRGSVVDIVAIAAIGVITVKPAHAAVVNRGAIEGLIQLKR